VETEGIAVFTESVDVWVVGQLGAETNVLLFEDQGSSASVEKNLAVILAPHSEGEGVLGEADLESGVCNACVLVLGAGKDLFLNLEDLLGGVVDLHMKTLVYVLSVCAINLICRGNITGKTLTGLVFDDQLQVLDVLAVQIAPGARESKVGSDAGVCLYNIRSGVARAVVDRGPGSNEPGNLGVVLRYRNCGDKARAGGEPEQ